MRLWPGMDAEAATVDAAGQGERRARAPGRRACARGGASDASHLARVIPLTVDGLGPRGGKAHNPGEFVLAASLAEPRGGRARAVDGALRGVAGRRADRERLQLARAHAARAARRARRSTRMRRDAALLEVDAPAGEVEHDLLERRVVPDDEDAVARRSCSASSSRTTSTSNPLPTASRSSGVTLSASQASAAVPAARSSGLV